MQMALELAWLEDFLEIVDCGGFTLAAERRNITQPAFSRHVRALEEWVGASLFDRGTHRVTLTPAGECFRPIAEEVLRRIYLGRDEVREAARTCVETLRFASTHALSLTFFPAWLHELEERSPLGVPVRLVADHMVACERAMLQGQVQFLLCHHHPAAANVLGPEQFCSLPLGGDVLVPVSAPTGDGDFRPRYMLPGTPEAPLPYLAFSKESGMGRILAAVRALDGPPARLDPAFTSHAVVVLRAMAREGRGIAWAPMSLVEKDLATGRLVRAGSEEWDVPMEIRIVRHRLRQGPAAERFWSLLLSEQH